MPAISAAPTMWRPAFVGGSLGSGLNASLLRKLQILAYWLGIIFPGVNIELVQGSPSGSVASGGTHAGPGDAADLQILVNGNRAPVGVYIIASLIMRLLFCLAYVRGQDVNGDGVKDDSFDPHLHIIDREGNKVPAAAVQILQFAAHLNGLVGGHPDLEASVGSPIVLADYTDALFHMRFMALTPAAATIAAHTEPASQEDDMPRLLLATDGTGWLVSDRGITPIGSVADAKVVRRVLDATQWDPASTTTDKVSPAELTIYQGYVAKLNQAPAPVVTTTVNVDPATIEAALNKALDSIAWTTRKA